MQSNQITGKLILLTLSYNNVKYFRFNLMINIEIFERYGWVVSGICKNIIRLPAFYMEI